MLKTMSDLSTIGGRIKYYRLLNGLRQKDIYEKIKIDKSTYIRHESKSTTSFDLEICRKICDVIGIDPILVYDDYLTFISSDYRTTLRKFRKKHKLTHKKFGALIDMHPKISAIWENGKSEPSRVSHEKIKELFIRFNYNI